MALSVIMTAVSTFLAVVSVLHDLPNAFAVIVNCHRLLVSLWLLASNFSIPVPKYSNKHAKIKARCLLSRSSS